MSGRTKRLATKRPVGQNVRRDKMATKRTFANMRIRITIVSIWLVIIFFEIYSRGYKKRAIAEKMCKTLAILSCSLQCCFFFFLA
jgi:hypothetical protein